MPPSATSTSSVEQADDKSAASALEVVLGERNRLWDELHRLKAERREVEYYENTLAEMRKSLSWRITAPLRVGKRYAHWAWTKIGR